MTQPTSNEPTSMPSEKAGFGRRGLGVMLSVAAIAGGIAGLVAVPERCRWLGYAAAILFVPAGAFGLFASLRGRKQDLASLSLRETAEGAATSIVERVADEVVDKAV